MELIDGEIESIVTANADPKEGIDYERILDQYKALVLPSKLTLADLEDLDQEDLTDLLMEDGGGLHRGRQSIPGCDAGSRGTQCVVDGD
ncbi:MAG: hypothetical protein M9950_06095 [Thermomicrobiales bacterium]|nr:hypothetical protein [Thermomicrobiales bacterium]